MVHGSYGPLIYAAQELVLEKNPSLSTELSSTSNPATTPVLIGFIYCKKGCART